MTTPADRLPRGRFRLILDALPWPHAPAARRLVRVCQLLGRGFGFKVVEPVEVTGLSRRERIPRPRELLPPWPGARAVSGPVNETPRGCY